MLTTILFDLFAIAGGGGSGGGGGGFSGGSSSGSSIDGEDFWPIGLPIIVATVIFATWVSIYAAKKRKEIKQKLDAAAMHDKVWANLPENVEKIFRNHQRDWQNFDISSMKTYMTPRYFEHTQLMMAALKLLNRQNKVEIINVGTPYVNRVNDATDDSKDMVSLRIRSTVNDIIYDTKDQKDVYTTRLTSFQTYNFRRQGSSWLIDSIGQSTQNTFRDMRSIKTFAEEHQYHYSPDWGYLLLPQRGQLFKGGRFGISDINNHVIGLIDKIVFQIYSYSQSINQRNRDNYVVAQTAIPKYYDNIVVRHKKGLFNFGIKGLKKIKTEWADFNNVYEVFATSPEQATSLELLDPKFMEKLEAVPFEVNIEVVDNIVYLYTPLGKVRDRTEIYKTMLGLLNDVFRTMRQ